MSLSGLKKQVNKANQFVAEKVGGVKGSKFSEEFSEMERKVDVISALGGFHFHADGKKIPIELKTIITIQIDLKNNVIK